MGRKKEGDIIVGQIGGEGLLWRENMVGGARAWHVPGAPQHGDPALLQSPSFRLFYCHLTAAGFAFSRAPNSNSLFQSFSSVPAPSLYPCSICCGWDRP